MRLVIDAASCRKQPTHDLKRRRCRAQGEKLALLQERQRDEADGPDGRGARGEHRGRDRGLLPARGRGELERGLAAGPREGDGVAQALVVDEHDDVAVVVGVLEAEGRRVGLEARGDGGEERFEALVGRLDAVRPARGVGDLEDELGLEGAQGAHVRRRRRLVVLADRAERRARGPAARQRARDGRRLGRRVVEVLRHQRGPALVVAVAHRRVDDLHDVDDAHEPSPVDDR
mmetsp:Transcript_29825/g.97534  ORF Transcript_29825/g.97534 Transcript_29825/m.97534 type:complete len:231 (-) Transcript_29825:146-838(-)